MSRLLLTLLALPLFAQDPLATPGFRHFYNLEYDQAIADFEREIAREPSSADAHNHLAQAIQFRELFRVGALESELVSGNNSFLRRPKVATTADIEARFFAEVAEAVRLSEAKLAKKADDPLALYSLGVAQGLRANWNFLVRKSWREALKDATAARKTHNRVTELDPTFIDAKLTQGAHDYLVGSLPFTWRMLGLLTGVRGDKDKGIETIREVARYGRRGRYDAAVFLCALYRRENRWKDAAPVLEALIVRFPRNWILRFELAQMQSALGDKDKALAALDEVRRLKDSGSPGFATLASERIEYQAGNILFWYRDWNGALTHLEIAGRNTAALDLNSAALTWMRIGQVYDMTNRRERAMNAYRKAIETAPEAEAAKESKRYLSTPYRRAADDEG